MKTGPRRGCPTRSARSTTDQRGTREMVDERQYFESIGDILTQMQAEAMRAIPLGRGLIGAEITVVDLLTAIILDRDILRALVDGGRPPQVGALRERRRPRPTTSHQPAGPIVQYAVALPGGEVKLNDEVRAALDASRGRSPRSERSRRWRSSRLPSSRSRSCSRPRARCSSTWRKVKCVASPYVGRSWPTLSTAAWHPTAPKCRPHSSRFRSLHVISAPLSRALA